MFSFLSSAFSGGRIGTNKDEMQMLTRFLFMVTFCLSSYKCLFFYRSIKNKYSNSLSYLAFIFFRHYNNKLVCGGACRHGSFEKI